MSDFKQVVMENQIARKIKDSANQIWLAGLGAYSKAEKEGGKLFETLVKDGERTRKIVDKQLSACRGVVEGVKDKVEDKVDVMKNSWGRLEKAFDERVSSALARLNIPTKQDIEALTKKVTELEGEINQLKDEGKELKAQPETKSAPAKARSLKAKSGASKAK